MRFKGLLFLLLFQVVLFAQENNSSELLEKEKADSILLLKKKIQYFDNSNIGKNNALIYFKITKLYFEISEYDSSLVYLNKTLPILSENKLNEEIKQLDKLKADIYYAKRQYQKAIPEFKKQLKNYSKDNKSLEIAEIYSSLGISYLGTAKLDSALYFFKNALSIRKTFKDIDLILGRNYNNIGVVYWQLGMFDFALENYLLSLKAREKAKDFDAIPITLNNIGLTYQELNQGSMAIDYHKRALELSINHPKLSLTLGYSYNSLGKAFKSTKIYDSALACFDKSIIAYEERKILSGKAFNSIDIAAVYKELKDYKKSLQFLYEALEFYEKSNNPRRTIEVKALIGENYLLLGDYIKARHSLTEALDLGIKINQRNSFKNIYLNLSKTENGLKSFNSAYNYLLKYTEIQDSMINERFQRIAAEEKIKYQTGIQQANLEKKETEIQKQKLVIYFTVGFIICLVGILVYIFRNIRIKNKINSELEHKTEQLNKLNQEVNSMNDSLKEHVATKDKFFSIISHDLRSPFQSFIGLTEFISENIDDFSKEEVAKLMKEMNINSLNLYELLKNLLEWSKMQRGLIEFNPEIKDLSLIISQTISLIKESANQKDIKIIYNYYNEINVNLDKNMIDSVLRNLLSNAIKFTPKNGTINVTSKIINESYVEVMIADTGLGMNSESLENLFKIDKKVSQVGTDGEESTGLGLILCKDFIEKHNGKIWAESIVNEGTRFYFTLPL